jgi:hypothetical protein
MIRRRMIPRAMMLRMLDRRLWEPLAERLDTTSAKVEYCKIPHPSLVLRRSPASLQLVYAWTAPSLACLLSGRKVIRTGPSAHVTTITSRKEAIAKKTKSVTLPLWAEIMQGCETCSVHSQSISCCLASPANSSIDNSSPPQLTCLECTAAQVRLKAERLIPR